MAKILALKHCFALFVLALMLKSCITAPDRDCNLYKKGDFQSLLLVGNDTLLTTFSRDDKWQIEHFEGKRDTFFIRWVNDCEYVLKKKNPTDRYEAKSNHIKILTTTDSSYTFEFNIVGETTKLRGTVLKN